MRQQLLSGSTSSAQRSEEDELSSQERLKNAGDARGFEAMGSLAILYKYLSSDRRGSDHVTPTDFSCQS